MVNTAETTREVLLGRIGPEYEFLFMDVGMNGRNSNGGNWSQNPLKVDNSINLPRPSKLPCRSKDIPYVCVGDDAFPLSSHMMKPYPQKISLLKNACLIIDYLG